MKAKYIILLVVCAVVTLSFTMSSNTHVKEKANSGQTTSNASPAGGIVSEDPIR